MLCFCFSSLLAQGCIDTHDYCSTWGTEFCKYSYFENMLKKFYCKKMCNACWWNVNYLLHFCRKTYWIWLGLSILFSSAFTLIMNKRFTRQPNKTAFVCHSWTRDFQFRYIFKIMLSARHLKGLCHPTRMREPMKTNLKKLARLFQVLSEILESCFYLSKSQPSFDS